MKDRYRTVGDLQDALDGYDDDVELHLDADGVVLDSVSINDDPDDVNGVVLY